MNQELEPPSPDKVRQTAPPAHANAFAKSAPVRPKRTTGEWLVDTLVYPIVNNIGVFAISVGATYLTSKGHEVGKEGSTLRKVGNWFHKRGEVMVGAFKKTGMSNEQADMAKTVFFSFADGTVIAPFVKLLEDRREAMAKRIDTALGTKPKDESVYKVEPKQTWGSVIKGRLLTSLVVVPTAVAMDGVRRTDSGWKWRVKDGESLNDIMFRKPGFKTGEKIAAKPKLAKHFGKLDLPELFKITYFEAFYTSVCTVGLYFISRALARQRKEHKEAIEEYRATHARVIKPNADAQETVAGTVETAETPVPHVSQASQVARLAETPQTQGLNA